MHPAPLRNPSLQLTGFLNLSSLFPLWLRITACVDWELQVTARPVSWVVLWYISNKNFKIIKDVINQLLTLLKVSYELDN